MNSKSLKQLLAKEFQKHNIHIPPNYLKPTKQEQMDNLQERVAMLELKHK